VPSNLRHAAPGKVLRSAGDANPPRNAHNAFARMLNLKCSAG
jgi:hypothetical protein